VGHSTIRTRHRGRPLTVSTLTTARSLPERAPEVGELVQVRSRRWLVEEVVPPSAPNQSSLMKLACADDDAQGQSLNVFRDYEIDRAILKEEGWPRLPGHCHSSARQARRSSESGKASSSSNVRRRGGSAAGPTGASPGSVAPICCSAGSTRRGAWATARSSPLGITRGTQPMGCTCSVTLRLIPTSSTPRAARQLPTGAGPRRSRAACAPSPPTATSVSATSTGVPEGAIRPANASPPPRP
jgi:hypothetical protein